MVLLLGSALDLPLRDRNALLEASGFVAAYRDAPLDAPQSESLRRAVELVLEAVSPNGAVVVDHAWNLLRMNRTAKRLFELFVDMDTAPPDLFRNVVVTTLHPLGLRPSIVNFDEVAALTLDRGRRELLRAPDDPLLRQLAEGLANIPGLPTARSVELLTSPGPFLTLHLKRGDVEARIFSTIATIGTPIDATAEELRIETFFPVDATTFALLRHLSEEPPK
jgi:hypothetical protein